MKLAEWEHRTEELSKIRKELITVCQHADEEFYRHGTRPIIAPPRSICAYATAPTPDHNTGARVEEEQTYPSPSDNPRASLDTSGNSGAPVPSPQDRPGRGTTAGNTDEPLWKRRALSEPAAAGGVRTNASRFPPLVFVDSSGTATSIPPRHEKEQANTTIPLRPDTQNLAPATGHMQTAADTSSDARARIPTGCRYKGKPLASDPPSHSDEERLSDQPGAPAGVDEAAAPLNPEPNSPPRLLLVSTPFGYRPSKETAEGIMASYPVLLAQAKQSGYGAVPLIGPAMNTAATRPRMVLPPSWPTDAGEAIRTLEVRIEVLNRAAATHALQHQQDLLEARNGAASDAAQAITLLRFQLDQRTTELLHYRQLSEHLRLLSDERVALARGARQPHQEPFVRVQALEQEHGRLLHHAHLLYNGCMTRDADVVRLKAVALAAIRYSIRLESKNPAVEPPLHGDPRVYSVTARTISDVALDLLNSAPPSTDSITDAEAFLRQNWADRGALPPLHVFDAHIPPVPGPMGPPHGLDYQPHPYAYTGKGILADPASEAVHEYREEDLEKFLESIPDQYSLPLLYMPWNSFGPPSLAQRRSDQDATGQHSP